MRPVADVDPGMIEAMQGLPEQDRPSGKRDPESGAGTVSPPLWSQVSKPPEGATIPAWKACCAKPLQPAS